MSRLTGKDKARNVAAVRAAIEQLLQGDLPLDGKYDLTTLASMAGVARTGFYSRRARDGSVHPGAYQHLAEEFEHRLKELQEAGEIVDPRLAQVAHLEQQIARLADENARLRQEVAGHDELIKQLRTDISGGSGSPHKGRAPGGGPPG
ncbi:hypothetical protein [Kitasatospora sp. GAS204B]|uniref:hypothetical protein n=1 Tax=unclassified Kitasatospora TaxID=2633591 RepID=UPI0024759563|nr:hypothetical protein [Kitasatospora sp. GAS204B]MDH6119744.1 hypothetical protein [Kitasatospora sp. GAS204B]